MTDRHSESAATDPIETFANTIRGQALLQDDDMFDTERRVWNGMIDCTPSLIARCSGAADVIQAVNFARESSLPLAVRGGGHSVAGNSVCDGGLMIDLSPMKGIRVDPVNRTARAEPGLTWGEFDRETQAFGLATPGGVVSSTGVSGLTLGGGVGWLTRSYGLACDNLLSVDVVTADGKLVTASEDKNSDLFWAVRGGGGNFGVVTSFKFQLHPVGPEILGGLLIWPREMAWDVLRLYREFTENAPENASAYAALATTPEGDPVVVMVCFYNGPIAEGERLLKPIREFGPPMADLVEPTPYTSFQKTLDEMNPAGNRVYWKSAVLRGIDDEVLGTIIEQAESKPSAMSSAIIEFYGGAANRIAAEETAYPLRDAMYALNAVSMWDDAAEDQANIDWARGMWESVRQFSPGSVYVNFLGVGDNDADRVKAAYGTNYARLKELKKRYDPENLFRLNQNIPPD